MDPFSQAALGAVVAQSIKSATLADRRIGYRAAVYGAMVRCDPIIEVSFELLKVSQLRVLKRRRFLRALFSAAVVFLFIFATHFIRM